MESGGEWLSDCVDYVRQRGITRFEPAAAAERRWTDHVVSMYSMMLMRKAKGWFTGYNSNVPGHEEGKVRYFVYNGGSPKYVSIINKAAADGYQDVVLDAPSAARDRQPHAAADQKAAAQAR